MGSEIDEGALWSRVRDGDAEAFGAVFDLHHARVFRQARRVTATVHDAEDVTALVFLEAWRRRASVRVVDGTAIGWLAVTATNVARNVTRSRNRQRALIARLHEVDRESAWAEDHAVEVGERLDREAGAAAVRRALAALPARDRDVITLCVLQEMSTAEAAKALGVAPGTVKSRLSRARARLSAEVLARLQPRGGEEEAG
ncbi:RNA polymerase sigma factor [Herbiconiux moechotypicola]|uniref:RNA polymerase sigma factor n=1 Tax=Herbiconiux moechotypicola TaxID=637393 RepID=A0ABN3E5P0_9MICO|nr:RNA polymerase sigma factor [Herbiconiux moechotypicola]MCS5731785.1 RNA polymerase sigma factor [Herbiconiux moechotypicola]